MTDPTPLEELAKVIHEETCGCHARAVDQDHGIASAVLAWMGEQGYVKPAPDDWEYAQSEVLADGSVAFGSPVESLEEAIRRRDIDRLNYPWPEELGVGRRRPAGPWEEVVPDGK